MARTERNPVAMMEEIRVGTDNVARKVIDEFVDRLEVAIEGGAWVDKLSTTLGGVLRETVADAVGPMSECLQRIELEVGVATDRLEGLQGSSSDSGGSGSSGEMDALPLRTRDALRDDLSALGGRLEKIEDRLAGLEETGSKLESALQRIEEMTANVLRQQFHRSETRLGDSPSGGVVGHAEGLP